MTMPYRNRQFAGSIRVAGEWIGCHVLQPTTPGWYEYRIDLRHGECESGVAQTKDVQLGEHPEALEAIGL